MIAICIIIALICANSQADVAHLIHGNDQFNGYNYDPPSNPLPFPTTFRPEIIVNKAQPPSVYLPPSSTDYPFVPPAQDEIDNGYLPPFNEEIPTPVTTEPNDAYLPPIMVPVNHYLPPPDEETDSGYQYSRPKQSKGLKDLFSARNVKTNALQIVINNLRCLQGHGGYFRAHISVQSFIENLPIVDLDTIDPRCQLKLSGVRFVLNIRVEDFQRCGISACGHKELCLNLRFPQIFAMKSLDDGLLTLKCKIQERVATKTHTLRLGVSNLGQARNAVVFAHGGSSQPLRTHLGLYRHSGSGFSRNLGSGATVQLGEELMLRAQVKAGDGWNHSRVSDVTLQRIGSNGEVLNTAQLIKSNGCVNPSMQSICPHPPVFEPPLGYRFGFRAVMFQGMKNGDEMQMSVRIVGCVDSRDCHLQEQNCNDDSSILQANRVKRNLVQSSKTISTDQLEEPLVEISNISFRVLMPINQQVSSPLKPDQLNRNGKIAIFTTIAIVGLLLLVIFIFIVFIQFQKHRKHTVFDKY